MNPNEALIANAFRGPGSDVAARITLTAYDDAVSAAGPDYVRLAALNNDGRVRVYAGNFSLVAPLDGSLWVTVKRSAVSYSRASEAGAITGEDTSPRAHPNLVPFGIKFTELPKLEEVLRTDLQAAASALTAAGRPSRAHVDRLLDALRDRVTAFGTDSESHA